MRKIVWVIEARMSVPGHGVLVDESFIFETEQAALDALPALVKEFAGKGSLGQELEHWWIGPEYVHTSKTTTDTLFDVPEEIDAHVFTPMGIRIGTHKEEKMSNYGQKLRALVIQAAEEFDNDDFADVLSTMIEEAAFDYGVYVALPGMMESVLESVSERHNDELMMQAAESAAMENPEFDIQDDDDYEFYDDIDEHGRMDWG